MAVLPTGIGPVTGYNIERSLRFNSADSAYLNRTPASTTNQKTWTFSCWMKRGTLGTNGMSLISAGTATNNGTSFYFSNDQLIINNIVGGGSQGAASTPAVLRDPSSWYHIVLSMDTTQTSFANGWAKIYINGVQQTLTQVSAPTQNSNTFMNLSTNAMWIARDIINSNYFNGYLTEVNFIDGSAKTPIDFGETDSNTGVWKPKAYTGTYGTNGFYLPFKTASQWSGYFDGTGDYASFSPTSALNAGTGDFTLEFWTFHLTSSTYQGYYYGGATGSINFRRTSSNTIELAHDGVTSVLITSTTIPANQWVHVAVTRNSGTVRIFINGVSGGSVTYTGNFSSTGGTGTIGSITPSIYNLNGYISNLRLITGTALYTANFTPPTAQLTAVSGTQLLTCQSSTFVDNSTNVFTITAAGDARPQQFSPFTLDVTDDHSGQGNHWIPNNLDLRTTGTGADILVDSPTNNHCTLNPVFASTTSITNGALDHSRAVASWNNSPGSFGVTSGKWYFEVTKVGVGGTTDYTMVGVANNSATSSEAYTAPVNSWSYLSTGNKYGAGTNAAYGATFTGGDVIGVALDMDAGTITFYKNNVSQGVAYNSGLVGPLFPWVGNYANSGTSSAQCNFGQRPFAYTAPSGFKALCTQNLPTPTIGATSTTQANDYFNILLYSGTGSSNAQTGVGFQPDFVWIKGRSGATDHGLYDAVRGVQKQLESNTTTAETTETTGLTAFGTDGFTVGALAQLNTSSATYVAWNWKANGTGVTNTAGTITSTVSANTTSGFSIVTYTGTGANATVGHGCQVGGVATAPSMVIVKNRSSGVTGWAVWHTGIGATDYLLLNLTNAKATSSTVFSAAPTSSVFSIGTDSTVNGNTNNLVAYCFAPVAGYSAFGSYTGNGSTDGPFVYTGFRPRYILVKRTDSADNWAVYDTARDEYNQATKQLRPDAATAQLDPAGSPAVYYDLLSNGFKNRGSNSQCNANGGTYIYAAFAEHPFKYSLAR